MSAADLAAVLLTIAGVGAVVVLLVASLALLRSLRALRVTVARAQRDLGALRHDLAETVRTADAELDRVDDLLGSAEQLSAELEGASRLVRVAVGNPLVKLLAWLRGLRAALGGRRRRRRRRRRHVARATEPRVPEQTDATVDRGAA